MLFSMLTDDPNGYMIVGWLVGWLVVDNNSLSRVSEMNIFLGMNK